MQQKRCGVPSQAPLRAAPDAITLDTSALSRVDAIAAAIAAATAAANANANAEARSGSATQLRDQ